MDLATIFMFFALIASTVIGVFISKRKVPIDEMEYMPETPDLTPQPVPVPEPVEVPVTPAQAPVEAPNPLTTLLPWTTQKDNYHNVRVLCDRANLTVDEKNIICACIYQESRFLMGAINRNKDKNGNVLSTDYSLIQVNDYYHIGPGKDFPSTAYVLSHPQEQIEWMIEMYKAGQLKQWVSYSSKAYLQWLKSDSPMWALKS